MKREVHFVLVLLLAFCSVSSAADLFVRYFTDSSGVKFAAEISSVSGGYVHYKRMGRPAKVVFAELPEDDQKAIREWWTKKNPDLSRKGRGVRQISIQVSKERDMDATSRENDGDVRSKQEAWRYVVSISNLAKSDFRDLKVKYSIGYTDQGIGPRQESRTSTTKTTSYAIRKDVSSKEGTKPVELIKARSGYSFKTPPVILESHQFRAGFSGDRSLKSELLGIQVEVLGPDGSVLGSKVHEEGK